MAAVGETVRRDVDNAHHQRRRAERHGAVAKLPGDHGELGEIQLRTYQGFSIIDTICTAMRSIACFSAAAREPPSSGTKLAIDCTSTGGTGASRGGSASPGLGAGRDRTSPACP